MELGDKEWVDSEIHREHTLISYRMNWYVASQAFLLTAFAISTNGEHPFRDILQLSMPIGGMLISIILWLSLIAALVSMRKLRLMQRSQCSSDFFEFWYRKRGITHYLGMLSPVFVPIIFSAIWYVLVDAPNK